MGGTDSTISFAGSIIRIVEAHSGVITSIRTRNQSASTLQDEVVSFFAASVLVNPLLRCDGIVVYSCCCLS